MSFSTYQIFVVACSCFSGVVSLSMLYSGNLFVEDLRDMYDLSYKVASIIPGIWSSSGYMGFLPALLFRRLGFRTSMMGMSFTIFLSFLGAAFSHSSSVTIFLLGGVAGPLIGSAALGSIYALNSVLPREVFHKALSIYSATGSIGLVVLPHLYRIMDEVYSIRGAFLVVGALMLNISITGAGLPNEKPKPIVAKEAGNVHLTRGELFKEPKFLLLNALLVLDSISFSAFNGFSMSLLTIEYGFSEHTASTIISVTGGLSVIGRLSVFFIGPNMKVSRLTISIIIMLIQGIAVLLMGAITSNSLVLCYALSTMFWISSAATFTLQGVVVSDLFPNAFDLAFSILLLNGCIVMISTPLLVGIIVDVTESFRTPMLLAGAAKTAGCMLPLIFEFGMFLRKKQNPEISDHLIKQTICAEAA